MSPRPATPDPRTGSLWDLGHFEEGRGLEIGPLAKVVVPRDSADVRYADVFDREGLVRAYAADPGVETDLIPEIDFPLVVEGRTRSLAEAAAPGAPYDWVMASHVVEHVPDLIGWLQEIATLVADGGSLVLAVPDKRYCFDLHRPATTVGAMIQAHELGDVRPSVRAVYDYVREVVAVDTVAAWRGHRPGFDARLHTQQDALAAVERVRAGEYVDCHVWMFTPDLFLQQLRELRRIGLSPWYVDAMVPTRRRELEFHVRLRRLPRGLHQDDPADEVVPEATAPHWVSDDVDARAEIARLRARLKEQRRELDAVRSSATWRVGRALVAPVGAVRRRLRRP